MVPSWAKIDFFQAALNGHIPTVQLLLDQYGHPIVDAIVDRDSMTKTFVDGGETALHAASRNGHLETVKFLVQQGNANVEATMCSGSTPLHLASRNGHLRIVQFLVEQRKANLEATDFFGRTPFHVACEDGHLEIVRFLLQRQCGSHHWRR
jgi:ankyrin repeat protein